MSTVLTLPQTAGTAITFDISSLASSASFLAGRESTQIDNTSTNYAEVMVYVKPITGHASTAPTVGQMIQLYVWGSKESLATTAKDVLDGTDSAETLSHASILQSLKFVAAPTVTVATAGLTYDIEPFCVAPLFGGVMPKFWGLFLSHNHTGALAASQSALFSFAGVSPTNT